MKQYLVCGKIVSLHGVRGEVKVMPHTDTVEEFCAVKKLYFDEGGTAISVSSRPNKHMVIMKIAGVNTPEQATAHRGKLLWLHRSDIKLAPGEYFIDDLIGMQVVDADDETITYGTLSDVFHTGANDVYEITPPAPEGTAAKKLLVPAIKDVVIQTDTENNRMLIRPLKGLFEDAD